MLDGQEGGFRLARAGGHTHLPVFDRPPAAPPIVGVAEHDGSCQAGAEGGFDLRPQQLGLARLAFAQGIEPDLAQQQRLGLGLDLQAREVVAEGLRMMEVNVEGVEVHFLRVQVFGRGKVPKGAKTLRVDPLGFVHQLVEESGNGIHTAPPHNIGRDLVGYAVGKYCRVTGAGIDRTADGFPRLRLAIFAVKKADMRVPRDIDQHPKLVFESEVQEPLGRHVINADHVGVHRADLRKVARGLLLRGKGLASRIGSKRTIRNALDMELLFAEAKELAFHVCAQLVGGRYCHEE